MIIIERDKEYDAFGPWIFEIDNDHEVPRIFKKYYYGDKNQYILFKVPRNIERRDASPDMDLYDYLIGAFDTYLYILKRVEKNVIEKKIYYSNILAIKDVHALSKGELILFTENELLRIPYNIVSEEIILKFIAIIEKSYTNKDIRKIKLESIPNEYIPDKVDSHDLQFVNLFNNLQQINPKINLVAYQPRIIINKKSPELKEKLKNNSLSKTAFIINDKELIILEQEASVIKKVKEELNYSYLYIPFQNIMGVKLSSLDNEQYLCSMELNIKNRTFTYVFESRNKEMLNLYYKLHEINYIK